MLKEMNVIYYLMDGIYTCFLNHLIAQLVNGPTYCCLIDTVLSKFRGTDVGNALVWSSIRKVAIDFSEYSLFDDD